MYAELMRKKCSKCNEEKSLDKFSSKRGQKNSRCKECISKYMRAHYQNNKEVESAKRRKYYRDNREKYLETVNKYYKGNHEAIRVASACRRRGITIEAYYEMLKQQNHVCAICEKPNNNNKRLAIDHDHTTGKVRELLCDNCNTSLGLLKEDIQRISKLQEYIVKHKK